MLLAGALIALLLAQPDAEWVQSGPGRPKPALARQFGELVAFLDASDPATLATKLGVKATLERSSDHMALTVSGRTRPRVHAEILGLGQTCEALLKRLGPPTGDAPASPTYHFHGDRQRGRITYTCSPEGRVATAVVSVTFIRVQTALAVVDTGLKDLLLGDDSPGLKLTLGTPGSPDHCLGKGVATTARTFVVAADNAARAATWMAPWGIDPNVAATVVAKLGTPTRCTPTEIAYPGITFTLSGTRIERLRIERDAVPWLAQRKLERSASALIDMTHDEVGAYLGGTPQDVIVQRGALYAQLQPYSRGSERWPSCDVIYTPGFAFDSLPGLDLTRWSKTLKTLGRLPPGVSIEGDTLIVETRAKGWLAQRGSGGALLASALGSAYLYVERLLGPPKVTDLESPPELDVWWVRVPSSRLRTAAVRLRCGPSPTLCYRLEIRGEDATLVD